MTNSVRIDTSPNRYQSVSERLSTRLDALEPVVERLLSNEAKLIADSVTAQAALATLADVTQAMMGDIEATEREMRTAQGHTFMALSEFKRMPFWQRLRWLVTGRC